MASYLQLKEGSEKDLKCIRVEIQQSILRAPTTQNPYSDKFFNYLKFF